MSQGSCPVKTTGEREAQEITEPLWRKTGDNYVNRPLPAEALRSPLAVNAYTLEEHGAIRNARIEFQIEILSEGSGVAAAVLFRKNGWDYLGAGLGGWGREFSLFAGSPGRIFAGYPIGFEAALQRNKVYSFCLEYLAKYVTTFSVNGERQISYPLSIHDTLGSSLSRGQIGLYAYGETVARFSVKVNPLPNRCFIITNIVHKETDRRREDLAHAIKGCGFDCELFDARDLRRDRPLMAKISEGIMCSDVVIADFGFQEPRPNVFYETGIAHSLGIPTIHIGPSRADFPGKVPSDLKPQFFVLEEELGEELPKTMKAILESNVGHVDYLGAE